MGIVDARALSRAGLRGMLEALRSDTGRRFAVSVIAEGKPGRAAALVRSTRPDIVLSGAVHGRDSLPLLHTFADLTPSPAVLVITEHVTEADARTLLAHGVGGILLHRSAARHLAWALAAVADGSRALSPEIADAVIGGCAAPLPSPCKAQHRVNSLSPREREVLALLGDGLPNRAIGEALHISPDTVKDHVRTLCTKLRAANRIQAARIAWQAGLTAVPA